MKNLFKTIPTTSWWEKIKLSLIREKHYGYYFGDTDKSVITVFKNMNGTIYLVDVIENQIELRNGGTCLSCGEPMIVPKNEMAGAVHNKCRSKNDN